MQLEKRANRLETSPLSTATTAANNRSDSEEHIIPAPGKGDLLITKTTEIEVQEEYDQESETFSGKGW